MQATEKNTVSGRRLFREFLEKHLGVKFLGFQGAFGHGEDLILFLGPAGSTLAVPVSTMHKPLEEARRIVKAKIATSHEQFDRADDIAAINRFWETHSLRGVRESAIGRAIAAREAA